MANEAWSEPVRRFIVRGHIRVEITGCFWCGTADHVCAACVAKADAAALAAKAA